MDQVDSKEVDLSECPSDSDNIFVARLDELDDRGIMPDKDRFMTAVEQSKTDFVELTAEFYSKCNREFKDRSKLFDCQKR